MKTIKQINSAMGVVIIATALMFTTSCQKEKSILPGDPSDPDSQKITARESNPVIPPGRTTYSLLSKKWWQWAMELPLQGHPFIDDPSFDVTEGQSGSVWFLAGVFGTVVRNCTIPAGKELFVGLVNGEASSLEGLGTTETEQRTYAKWQADHFLNVFATVDGNPVMNINSFRVMSPQFQFTAPTPWIFGTTGGTGTAVADGYYLLLKPLSTGTHTLHFGGALHFSIAEGDPFDLDASIDMTYNLTIQ